MYTLYYSPGACSFATQVVLRELEQEVNIIDITRVNDFKTIAPVGAVPVLIDGNKNLTEGAAIMLYLLNKHKSTLYPENESSRQQAIQNIMFANATMHPAYGRLFFIEQNIRDEKAKYDALNAATKIINHLWQVVENQLNGQSRSKSNDQIPSESTHHTYLGGEKPSAADIMLTVYSRWGAYFPVDIVIGEKTLKMLSAVQKLPSFIRTGEAEKFMSGQ